MHSADLLAILPLLLLSGATVVVMLSIAIRRSHALAFGLTLAGLAAAFATIPIAAGQAPRDVTTLLVIDRYALLYTAVILAATFAVAVLAYSYQARREGNPEELYLLLLIATTGAVVLVSAGHFVSFFLGLEILSVPLYALIGYQQTRRQPLEAALKYLVLAAASAAFLLFGMALVYLELGTMRFADMAAAFNGANLDLPILLAGFALIVTGFGFKLAVVPFHLWTPDVYQGASAPVTAYIATVSKGAMFGLLLRYFHAAGANYPPLAIVFAIIAIASMIAGNLLALLQNNVKRILAYSSIAHLGYMLVAFQAGSQAGAEAVTFYVIAYFVTTLGAFGVVTLLSTAERDADQMDDYRGLFWRRPALAAAFTAMLLSLAGIPLTAGFIGKFYLVAAGASAADWAQIIILVVTSAIGLYYYLRIVVAVYSAPEAEAVGVRPAAAGSVILAVLTAALIWLGVYPAPLLDVIRRAVAAIT